MSRRMSSRRAEFPTALLEMAQNRTALLRMHSPSKPNPSCWEFSGSFISILLLVPQVCAEAFIEDISGNTLPTCVASDSRRLRVSMAKLEAAEAGCQSEKEFNKAQ